MLTCNWKFAQYLSTSFFCINLFAKQKKGFITYTTNLKLCLVSKNYWILHVHKTLVGYRCKENWMDFGFDFSCTWAWWVQSLIKCSSL